MKRILSLLLSLLLILSVGAIAVPAMTVNTPDTIRSSLTLEEDGCLSSSGMLTVEKHAVLTVPKGRMLTIPNAASLAVKGNLDARGTVRIEKGGRVLWMEDGSLKEYIGPDSDIGTDHTPVLAIRYGSLEITDNHINVPADAMIRVARSARLESGTFWTMEDESEIKYDPNVQVDVQIYGPDVTKESTKNQYARIITGVGSRNKVLNLLPASTYYWLRDRSQPMNSPKGFWQLFNGIAVLGDTSFTEYEQWSDSCRDASRQNEPPYTKKEGTIYKDVVYDSSRKTHNQYDLYIPGKLNKKKPQSLILCIHGGSWATGNKHDMDYLCARYARKGYICATLDYRLFNLTLNTSGTKTEDAATNMDQLMDDIQACINHIKIFAAKRGYRIDQMATTGYSAGGHLALLYAYSRPKAASIPCKFCFPQVGPADFHKEAWAPGFLQYPAAMDLALSDLIPGYRDMTPDQKEKAIQHISPISYVNSKTVPTVMTYAAEDVIVGYQHGIRLDKKLTDNDVDHVFVTLKKSNHSSEFDRSSIDQFYHYVDKYLIKYLS
ncbi:MAG: prolyl oligopeptidase family serine peptidase [Bariatricus sp.]